VRPFTFQDTTYWGCLPVNTTTTLTIAAFPADQGSGGGAQPAPLLTATASALGAAPSALFAAGGGGAAAAPPLALAAAAGGAGVCLTGAGEFGFCAPLLQPLPEDPSEDGEGGTPSNRTIRCDKAVPHPSHPSSRTGRRLPVQRGAVGTAGS
jgi:hypothetical protein